jgi:transposase InsO family protein
MAVNSGAYEKERVKLHRVLPTARDQAYPRRNRIGKPTTLGKIERWFRTYDLEHVRFPLHWKFVEYYNWERPHIALGYSIPAEVYFRDVRDVLG